MEKRNYIERPDPTNPHKLSPQNLNQLVGKVSMYLRCPIVHILYPYKIYRLTCFGGGKKRAEYISRDPVEPTALHYRLLAQP